MSTDELQALGTYADLSLSDEPVATQRAQAEVHLQVARSTGASWPVAALKRCQE
jgi:hypothetical protein